MGGLALTLLVCWFFGLLILFLTVLVWPILPWPRFKSSPKAACYGESMSHDEIPAHESASFRRWLLAPILARIDHMAKTLADLNVSIANNTTATNAAVAAFTAGSAGDFTTQTTAIDANTAKLAAIAPAGTTPPGGTTPPAAGTITANPANVTLSATVPTQVVTLAESNNQPNVYNAVSSNTAIATVSPASGPGPFTISRIGAGAGASVAFTDQQNNVLTVPVSAS